PDRVEEGALLGREVRLGQDGHARRRRLFGVLGGFFGGLLGRHWASSFAVACSSPSRIRTIRSIAIGGQQEVLLPDQRPLRGHQDYAAAALFRADAVRP